MLKDSESSTYTEKFILQLPVKSVLSIVYRRLITWNPLCLCSSVMTVNQIGEPLWALRGKTSYLLSSNWFHDLSKDGDQVSGTHATWSVSGRLHRRITTSLIYDYANSTLRWWKIPPQTCTLRLKYGWNVTTPTRYPRKHNRIFTKTHGQHTYHRLPLHQVFIERNHRQTIVRVWSWLSITRGIVRFTISLHACLQCRPMWHHVSTAGYHIWSWPLRYHLT